jgi:RHS repeat-associated protein
MEREKTTMRTLRFTLLAAFLGITAAAGAQNAAPKTEWVPSPSWDSGIYSYDGAGNITAIGDDEYRYDGSGRLLSGTARGPNGTTDTETYAYDQYGNLTKFTTGTFVTAMAVDPATNRLDGDCTGTYSSCIDAAFDDDTGAMNGRPAAGHTFDWDATGMLREIDVASRTERYLYDASDERIATVTAAAGGELRRYTLRGADQKVLRELTHHTPTDSWTWSKDYVYRSGTLLAAYVPDGNGEHPDRHYHVDHLGSPRVITDTRRNKIAEYTLWPFGADAPGSTRDGERMRFTGHERDSGPIDEPGTDFDYMHARYYSPAMKRFLSTDPGRDWNPAEPQSWNLYSYVRNDPIGGTDPTGREKNDVIRRVELARKGMPVMGGREATIGDARPVVALMTPVEILQRYSILRANLGGSIDIGSGDTASAKLQVDIVNPGGRTAMLDLNVGVAGVNVTGSASGIDVAGSLLGVELGEKSKPNGSRVAGWRAANVGYEVTDEEATVTGGPVTGGVTVGVHRSFLDDIVTDIYNYIGRHMTDSYEFYEAMENVKDP